MIKIWKVKVKVKHEHKPIFAYGFDEENHELIVWKHWINFAPESDFLHNRNLKQILQFMEALLKIGNYYVSMKREDKSFIYSANVVGVSPSMLGFITNYDRHTVITKLKELNELGYIDFAPPTRGEQSEMNILLNEYTKDYHKIFHISRDWLNENMIVDKLDVIAESEDWKTIKIIGSLSEVDVGSMVKNLPLSSFESTPGVAQPTPRDTDIVAQSTPSKTVNLINDIPPDDGVDVSELVENLDNFEGIARDFVALVATLGEGSRGKEGGTIGGLVEDQRGEGLSKFYLRKTANGSLPTEKVSVQEKGTQRIGKVNINSLSTNAQVVAIFYERETKLQLTESDLIYINELLKISSLPQITAAIKGSRVWKRRLPSDFESLSFVMKKKAVIEAQPGYWLKKEGLKHVYSFIKNSPNYRKDRRRMRSTGVVSGLNEERAKASQKKVLEELRKKKKEESDADGK
jgi:hypothetical protein